MRILLYILESAEFVENIQHGINADDNGTGDIISNDNKLYNDVSPGNIQLSKSVGVINALSKQLQLVYPLEETFRLRYKSDYFPQNGHVRKPRYVSDGVGNHFVSLKIPADYINNLTNTYIRVAWLTGLVNDKHYYSPYKFQTNNYNSKTPDENPIYVPVNNNALDDNVMKLHLVLIRSKLDQLKQAQPLKSFILSEAENVTSKPLNPKDLIETYKLEKSHLAFTLCTKQNDNTYIPHIKTTVMSDIMTEESLLKPTGMNTHPTEKRQLSTKQTHKFACPNCAHCFILIPPNIEPFLPYQSELKILSGKRKINNRVSSIKKLSQHYMYVLLYLS
ncbi:unnamed protein product [Didymodactylos carnosus]|uniref:Uncharacterized protein n=1 Tax=Didymodactylos carnosus TaxID=1234261 RepID=A0A814NH02_9BILA|nr:unnamed protein product [Didymodactylos carnosus]CAF3856816.1 unnamed protein product [Didymodactylos carnosus]